MSVQVGLCMFWSLDFSFRKSYEIQQNPKDQKNKLVLAFCFFLNSPLNVKSNDTNIHRPKFQGSFSVAYL